MSDSFATIIREGLRRFPAVVAVVFLSFGIVYEVCWFRSMESWALVALVPGLAFLLIAVREDRKILLWVATAALFFLIGRQISHNQVTWGDDFTPSSAKCVVHASVVTLWASGEGFRVFILEDGLNDALGSALPGRGRLTVRQNDILLGAGDRISFRSRLRQPVNRGNPGEYDWEMDCKHDGILWLASAHGPNSVVITKRGFAWSPNAIVFRARQAMARFLDQYSGKVLGRHCETFSDSDSPKHVRGFLKGVVLGDLGDVDHSLQRSFSASGLAHVLSASGLHVGIVVIVSLFVLRVLTHACPGILLWLPFRKLGALVSIPAIVFYCTLVGARVPAVRSGIMGVVIAVALLADRKWNSVNSLAVAALVILLMDPLSLFTVSFQLSFGAVAGIFLVVPGFMRSIKEKRPEKSPGDQEVAPGLSKVASYCSLVVMTSIAATLPIMPLILQTFHSFPVWTIPANLVTDLALTPALAFGLLAPAVGVVFPTAGSWLLAIADLISWFIIQVSFFFARLPFSVIRVPNLYPVEFLLCLAMAAALLWFVGNPNKRRSLALMAGGTALGLLICSLSFRHEDTELKVVFFNVGKGDAAFVRAPGSQGMLVDGGVSTQYFDAGRSIIIPFFDWAGVRSLDCVLISHPEMDHMGGLLSVAERVPIGGVMWNPVAQKPSHLEQIFDRAGRDKVFPAHVNTKPLKLGNASVTFLNSPWSSTDPLRSRDMNNSSVVARVEYVNTSFLFTGDLEFDGEDKLLSSGVNVSASVLKVGHHGGGGSTSSRFLEAVRPKIAVISVDYPSTLHVPHPKVLERLRAVGADVFLTGRDGAVTVESDGETIYVTTGRQYGDGPRLIRKAYR